MNPVHFGLVLAEVFVVLHLLWLKEHHVPSGDNMILAINIKMGLSGGYIQKLPVNTSMLPPCGQFLNSTQAVSAAAANDEGSRLVLEGYS